MATHQNIFDGSPVEGVDHIGIAVNDIDASVAFYINLGLRVVEDEVADDPGVRLAYIDAGNIHIQLVQPLRHGAISDWLSQKGEGLHHICFRTPRIDAALEFLRDDAPIFIGGRHRRACFLTARPNGVTIELVEQIVAVQPEVHG